MWEYGVLLLVRSWYVPENALVCWGLLDVHGLKAEVFGSKRRILASFNSGLIILE